MSGSSAPFDGRSAPLKAVLYRTIAPLGLVGGVSCLFLAAKWTQSSALFVIGAPVIVLLVVACCVRSAVRAVGRARSLAVLLGLVVTGLAAFVTFGCLAAGVGA